MSRSAAGLLLFLCGCATARPPEPPPPDTLFERVPVFKGVHGARVAFADLDADGRPDCVIDRTRVFMNRRGAFEEVKSGLAGVRIDFVQFGDVDGDGWLDAFTGGPENAIWFGDGGGGFSRAKETGLGVDEKKEAPISACFLDYDRDGVLDLFVAQQYVDYAKGLEAFPSRLFRGRGDGTFEDVTEKAGLLGVAEPGARASRKPAYGCAHADWNNDGLQDILVCTYGRQWNRLWRNNGDGTFTDVAEETTLDGDGDRTGTYTDEVKELMKQRGNPLTDEKPFRANGNTFDAAVADVDGDGDLDVFLAEITHWWAGPSSDRSMLLVNLGASGGFRFRREPDRLERRHAVDRWNQGDLHAGWLDVDNDGRLDLVVASSDYPDRQLLRLWRQRADGSFDDWTARLGFEWVNASQISFGDFDRDGATDLLVGTNNMRLTPAQVREHDLSVGLFRNTCAAACGNGFFNLRLLGPSVGARVTIWIEGRRQTREVHGGLGHAGHRDDTDCRFGVAKARVVDRVEVRWPDASGTVQTFERVEANRFYELEKGGALRGK